MYSKRSLVLFAAAAALLASMTLAANSGGGGRPGKENGRDTGNNVHQTLLDDEYARLHPTIVPGTPPRLSTPYAYVPPHRPAARHRHGVHR